MYTEGQFIGYVKGTNQTMEVWYCDGITTVGNEGYHIMEIGKDGNYCGVYGCDLLDGIFKYQSGEPFELE